MIFLKKIQIQKKIHKQDMLPDKEGGSLKNRWCLTEITIRDIYFIKRNILAKIILQHGGLLQ